MNKKHLVFGLIATLCAGGALLTQQRSADGATCANGYSKKVVKTGGTGSGYPSVCRIDVCRREGAGGIITGVLPFPELGIVTLATYDVVDGYYSTRCPSSVDNAKWSQ